MIRQSIAVVGGGISGLMAAYLLSRKHNVTLYEKTDRVGGNAYTWEDFAGRKYDIGVATFARNHLPLFYKMLGELKVKTRRLPGKYLSFTSLDTGEGIYLNPTLKCLRAQRYEVLKPKNLWRIYQLFSKVNHTTKHGLPPSFSLATLDCVCKHYFKFDEYQSIIFYGIISLFTSMPPRQLRGAPAWFFVKEFKKYPYFSWHATQNMEVVRGWTARYIKKLEDSLKDKIVYNAKVETLRRGPGSSTLIFKDGSAEFDKVVIATEADVAFKLLEDPTPKEVSLLGPWKYNDGLIAVHGEIERLTAPRETGIFPHNVLSGVYDILYTGSGDTFDLSVNGIASPRIVVTQYPNFQIQKDKLCFKKCFRTPLFDADSIDTIGELSSLNWGGHGNTYFCGSYFGFGLHEDAIESAVDVARRLGVEF